MPIIGKILTAIIAMEHLFILYVEMFAWKTKGKKILPQFEESFFELTAGMAANQGLYNGFLAAGLMWSVFIKDPRWSYYVASFFLICVLVAGIYGSLTSSKGILLKQGLPALIVLILVHLL